MRTMKLRFAFPEKDVGGLGPEGFLLAFVNPQHRKDMAFSIRQRTASIVEMDISGPEAAIEDIAYEMVRLGRC